MKGGVAAMCVAAARAAARGALASEIIITAVCDEEYQSIGTRALIEAGLSATAAIVTEPTRLAICPAHKGFAWFDIMVHGHAAHGSRPDVGVDAVAHAGLLLAEMIRHERTTLSQHPHPLLGAASMHAATITGGSGWSTYPEQLPPADSSGARCPVRPPRRCAPRLEQLCARVKAEDPRFRRGDRACTPCSRRTTWPSRRADRARAAARARRVGARPHRSTDCRAGPTPPCSPKPASRPICYGPGDIARAHGAEEWIERAGAAGGHRCARARLLGVGALSVPRLTVSQYDVLERAIDRGSRCVVRRRQHEYVVVPERLTFDGRARTAAHAAPHDR